MPIGSSAENRKFFCSWVAFKTSSCLSSSTSFLDSHDVASHHRFQPPVCGIMLRLLAPPEIVLDQGKTASPATSSTPSLCRSSAPCASRADHPASRLPVRLLPARSPARNLPRLASCADLPLRSPSALLHVDPRWRASPGSTWSRCSIRTRTRTSRRSAGCPPASLAGSQAPQELTHLLTSGYMCDVHNAWKSPADPSGGGWQRRCPDWRPFMHFP